MRTPMQMIFCERGEAPLTSERKWQRFKLANPLQMWDAIELFATDDFKTVAIPAPGTLVEVVVDITQRGKHVNTSIAELRLLPAGVPD